MPLAIDLFCGLGGWADGFIAEGYTVIGFDTVRHDYGDGGYPGHLVLQDVLTLHGSQFKDAAVIVASPPCQKYSYMAMPWSRAKKMRAEYLDGTRSIEELNALFNACFRIQKESCEAAGRFIPLIVENVKGAQPWIGRSAWHHGSFHLWGDIPALMPITRHRKIQGENWRHFKESGKVSAHWTMQITKAEDGIKQHFSGRDWWVNPASMCRHASKSRARARASAEIAKIPFPLAQHIARCFK